MAMLLRNHVRQAETASLLEIESDRVSTIMEP